MAALADSFDFFDIMSDLKKAGHSLESVVGLTEIEAESIGHDWEVEIDGNLHELIGLFRGEELRFVHEDAGAVEVVLLNDFV